MYIRWHSTFVADLRWHLRAHFCEPVLDIPRGLPLNKMILHYRDYHVRVAQSRRERAHSLYRGDNQKKEIHHPLARPRGSYGGRAREYRNEVLQRDGDEIRRPGHSTRMRTYHYRSDIAHACTMIHLVPRGIFADRSFPENRRFRYWRSLL